MCFMYISVRNPPKVLHSSVRDWLNLHRVVNLNCLYFVMFMLDMFISTYLFKMYFITF